MLTTFTQEPRRARVLAAKILGRLLLGLAATAYATLTSATGLALSSALGRTVTWDLDASHAAGLTLFVVLNSLMGMAFGALLHNTAAAIVLFYALPTAWSLAAIGARSTAPANSSTSCRPSAGFSPATAMGRSPRSSPRPPCGYWHHSPSGLSAPSAARCHSRRMYGRGRSGAGALCIRLATRPSTGGST